MFGCLALFCKMGGREVLVHTVAAEGAGEGRGGKGQEEEGEGGREGGGKGGYGCVVV